MRLDKFLCDLQIGSRSSVKEAIKNGMITVNGICIKMPNFKVDKDHDCITYKGEQLTYQSLYYYILHKPAGIVTATKDCHDKTVMDLLPQAIRKDLFPVGRLDKDTEGLLLLTNDGMLCHNLLSPKKHIEKTYYVECTGSINSDKLSQLELGVDIGDDKPTLPARVKLLSTHDTGYIVELTITEGRFHQVKRMIAAIEGCVSYLKRLSIGPLILGDLPKGAYRPLTNTEVDCLKNYPVIIQQERKRSNYIMDVLFGIPSDIEQWMKLVKRVSWNFPGLETEENIEEHSQTVLEFMSKKQALCIKCNHKIVGVLLFSRSHNMICCLAVSPEYRCHGIGSALLTKALSELDRSKSICVSTFRENDKKGIAPRKLYKKFGFKEAELIKEFGYPNQKFILYP